MRREEDKPLRDKNLRKAPAPGGEGLKKGDEGNPAGEKDQIRTLVKRCENVFQAQVQLTWGEVMFWEDLLAPRTCKGKDG